MNPFEQLMQFIFGSGAQAAPGAQAQLKPGDRPLENPNDPPPAPPPTPTPAPPPVATAQSNVPPVQPPMFAPTSGWGAGLGNTMRTLGIPGAPPRQEEYMAGERQQSLQMDSEAKQAMAAVLPEIQRIRDANPGIQPHELNRQLIQTPAFLQSAMRVPADKMQTFIGDVIKQGAAPTPTFQHVGNTYGSVLNGKFTPQGTAPTPEMQNNEYMLGLSPEKRVELMRIKSMAKPSDKMAALLSLRARGIITDEEVDKFAAGVIVPQTDPMGNQVRVDLTQGGPGAPRPGPNPGVAGPQPGAPQAAPGAPAAPGQPQVAPQSAAPAPGQPQQAQAAPADRSNLPPPADTARPGAAPAPGQAQAPFSPDAPAGTYSSVLQRPADMVDAASWAGWTAKKVGQISGQFDTSAVDPKISAQVNALAHYRSGVQKLSGRARQLKVEHELYDALAADPNGLGNTPTDAAVKALQLREKLDQRENQLLMRMARIQSGKAPRADATKVSEELDLIDGFKLYTDTAENWKAKIAELQAGKSTTTWADVPKALPSFQSAKEQTVRQLKEGEAAREQRGAPPPTLPPERLQQMDAKRFGDYARAIGDRGSPDQIRALREEIARRKAAVQGGAPR